MKWTLCGGPETLRRWVTASGDVQTNEEAQVYVHDLDLFVTVQLIEETPAVLSLGKLCSEHDWPKMGRLSCIMDNFVPLIVPGLSSSSSSSSASTSRPKDQSKSSGESESSTDPLTTRRAKHACGKPMQTNPDKQASDSRGSAHTENDRKSRGPGDACTRTSLWKRGLRFGRWCFKSGDTKTEAQYWSTLP